MQRPRAVTVLGILYIAMGAIGLVYHARELRAWHPFPYELAGVCLVRVLAVVAGIFMLRAADWARWLALAWILFHVVLSAFHSAGEAAMHAAFFLLFTYLLLRPQSARYFRPAGTGPTSPLPL
jgi:hypothetical protein